MSHQAKRFVLSLYPLIHMLGCNLYIERPVEFDDMLMSGETSHPKDDHDEITSKGDYGDDDGITSSTGYEFDGITSSTGYEFDGITSSSTGYEFDGITSSTGFEFDGITSSSTGFEFDGITSSSTGFEFDGITSSSTGFEFDGITSSTGFDFASTGDYNGLPRPRPPRSR